MADHDPIESRLGDVPLPAGLQQRLALEALFDDAAIDRLLRGVPIPAGLVDRVRDARDRPGRRSRSVDLDRRQSDVVPAPDRSAPPAESARWFGDRGRVVAACAGLAAMILVMAMVAGPPGPGEPRRPIEIVHAPTEPATVPMTGGRIDWGREPGGEPLAATPTPEPSTAETESPDPPATEPDPRTFVETHSDPNEAGGGGVGGGPPDVVGFPVAAASGRPAGLPMEVVPQLGSAGLRVVPRSPAYDLAFELRFGEPPFVYPQVGLATDVPPLTSRTASFDAIRWSPAPRIRRVEARRLRVEEVLAAAPRRFERRADGDDAPRLDLFGVRSLRPRTAALVEIAVTAPRLPQPAAAVEAAVVLDQSLPQPAWSAACRGLGMLAGEMRGADRLTIVVVGERSRVTGRRLDAAAVAAMVAGLDSQRPAAGPIGLDAAVRETRQEQAAGPVVCVSRGAGMTGMRSAAFGGDALLVRAVPAAAAGDADARLLNPVADEVGRAIIEQVYGRSALAATGCRLEVNFDPRLVDAYRLVGHRQTAVESLAAATPGPIEMLAGQTVRVVYEVVAKPGQSAAGPLAAATFTWRSTPAAAARSVSATLVREAIETSTGGDATPPGQQTWLPSAHGCELLLAVGLGELASESVHLGVRAGGPAVADLALGWRRRGDVSPWGDVLIDTLERMGFVTPARQGQSSGR